MKFLLDTNIVSAYLKGDAKVFNRFVQHTGGLAISSLCVGELYSWVYRSKTNPKHSDALKAVLSEVTIIAVDTEIAIEFGRLRATLLDQGRPTPEIDLLIAATALVHDLTLVTHNVRDFSHIEVLRLADWLE